MGPFLEFVEKSLVMESGSVYYITKRIIVILLYYN
ncbi:hypothetical protein SAMN05421790_1018 [Kroppenstedtia eburnea]|uniref:Uncharacterized protein n=1 Tax=Kroppenstedtia eburnea TaxID=714067 RepID=A0A1N7IKF1_9BACL|nr:hypothetical protein SAMN05421790_1018 [Kroppenstedtia eburnea]